MIENPWTYSDWRYKFVSYVLYGGSSIRSVLTSHSESQDEIIAAIMEKHNDEYAIISLSVMALTPESFELLHEHRERLGLWNLD